MLDLKKDKAMMFEEPVEFEITSSGHYCVKLMRHSLMQESSVSVSGG